MPNLSQITHFPLKAIFAIHLVLVSWAMQGSFYPRSALCYNLLFFVCLMWAVHNVESDEPLQFALCINILAIFLDIIALSVYFPHGSGGPEKFSAAILIINLLVRVITSVSLLRIGQARGGALATFFPPGPGMEYGRQQYEDISYPVPQNADFSGI